MLPLIKTRKKPIFTLFLCLSLILFPLISSAIDIGQIPNPRAINGTWVSDTANIISDRTEEKINRQIDLLEATNGTEIAVVTVSETKPAESPKEFTTELFNTWKIGKAEQDNGVLFLVSVADRRVEIETGIGIEAILPNAEINHIIQTNIIPFFKQQDFDRGIFSGVKALTDIMIQDDFTSAIPTQVNRASTISQPYQLNWFLLIMGCFASIFYYLVLKAQIKPIYLTKGGYSRNKYLKKSLKKWQVYTFVYLICVFLSAFVVVPILASISSYILLLYLASIQTFWLLNLRAKAPSLADFGTIVASPLVFIAASVLTYQLNIFSLIFFVLFIFRYHKNLYQKNQKNQVNFRVAVFALINFILFFTAGLVIIGSFIYPEHQPIFWFGIASSIALTSLVWQYFRAKPEFQSENNIYCADCKHSLNRVSNEVLHKYLKPQQQTAWSLHSFTYQGWQCPNCISTEDIASSIHICGDVNAVASLTNQFEECSICQELTVTHQTEIIEPATTRKKGLRLRTYTCQCCESTYEKEETIPRKSNRSNREHYDSSYSNYSSHSSDSSDSSYSSGDSGGSSFGGGESDGGGAGGDW